MARAYPFFCFAVLLVVVSLSSAHGQAPESDWYDASASYVRIAVAEDGVYAVDRNALEQAGLPSSADATTFRLFERGQEIPIQVESSDRILFVGTRNRGDDELWAYNNIDRYQSSDDRSLYSDTTYYWLTWGGAAGQRYADASPETPTAVASSVRDALYWVDRGSFSDDPPPQMVRANLDGSDATVLEAPVSRGTADLVVDAEAGMLYWDNMERGVVFQSNLDGTEAEPLVAVRRVVRALTLAP